MIRWRRKDEMRWRATSEEDAFSVSIVFKFQVLSPAPLHTLKLSERVEYCIWMSDLNAVVDNDIKSGLYGKEEMKLIDVVNRITGKFIFLKVLKEAKRKTTNMKVSTLKYVECESTCACSDAVWVFFETFPVTLSISSFLQQFSASLIRHFFIRDKLSAINKSFFLHCIEWTSGGGVVCGWSSIAQ